MFLLFSLISSIFISCGNEKIELDHKPETTVILSDIQQQVFNLSCAFVSCHSKLGRRGRLVLEEGESYSNLINVLAENEAAKAAKKLRVVPGNPDQSFLVQKLIAPGLGEGERMPYATEGLPEDKIQLIRKWIKDGAKQYKD